MGMIAQYILSITGAAMICAVIVRLLDGKGSAATIARMLTGIFMTVTAIGPIAQVRIPDVHTFLPDVSLEAQMAVSQGRDTAKKALEERISQQVEAYILDKAVQLDVVLTVQITLSDDIIPVPVGAFLQGNISPYAKTKLQNILKDDLGIEKENQIWT